MALAEELTGAPDKGCAKGIKGNVHVRQFMKLSLTSILNFKNDRIDLLKMFGLSLMFGLSDEPLYNFFSAG